MSLRRRKRWNLATRFVESSICRNRAYELAGCYDQLNLGGNASLEHVARVIQSFVGAVGDLASVGWSNQISVFTRLASTTVFAVFGS